MQYVCIAMELVLCLLTHMYMCFRVRQFLTHSADGNCKLWNADTRELVATFPMGKGRARMQVGGVITPDGPVVTLSKDGSFAFLDLESPDAAPSFIPSLDGPPSTLVGCPGDEPAVLVVFREGVMKYSVADAGLSAQLVLSVRMCFWWWHPESSTTLHSKMC